MATAATATITEVSPTEATTAGTGNPRIFSEEERQPFAAGVPAQGQSNLAGLQTPDLMNFIDVKIFEKQQRGPAPTISPHLLAATTSEHGKFVTGQNKRNRESNPFQTSFETLMKGGPAGAAKAAGRKSTDDVAPPPAPPVVGAAGKAKRKTRRVSTGDVTEEVRLESKRNRNRLAAVSHNTFRFFFSKGIGVGHYFHLCWDVDSKGVALAFMGNAVTEERRRKKEREGGRGGGGREKKGLLRGM